MTIMKKSKIAILGTYAMQFLERSIRNSAKIKGLTLDIYTADYNTTDFELLDSNSGLYEFKPDFIVWHESTLALRDQFYACEGLERGHFADKYVARVRDHLHTLRREIPQCMILFPDHSARFEDNVFGNYGNRLPISWQFQVSKINYLLHDLTSSIDNMILIHGRPEGWVDKVTDYTLVVNADLHYTLPYIEWLSGSIVKIIESQQGRFIKCVILDLDNTLWGGIIGDDGIEGIQIGSLGIGKAFTRLQKWLKELSKRGIILAVCSKNEEDIAKNAFLHHAEMILELDDISIFIANWESKSDNISKIQQILNIGFDSMVFLDDNPAEREIVRMHLPQVIVPELPEDPALYLPFLIEQNLFETATYAHTDGERTRKYKEESDRQQLAQTVTNMDEFLLTLQMKAKVSRFEEHDIERISQLTLRSNQFNLRTIRYSVAEVKEIMQDPAIETFSIELNDKFGNYGLISLVIVKLLDDETAFVDTWVMSCRVLKRTVEPLLMNEIVDRLRERGIKRIRGEYVPTEKNKLVKNLLPQMGFSSIGDDQYLLEIDSYHFLPTKISIL